MFILFKGLGNVNSVAALTAQRRDLWAKVNNQRLFYFFCQLTMSLIYYQSLGVLASSSLTSPKQQSVSRKKALMGNKSR